MSEQTVLVKDSVPTCVGVRICMKCDCEIERRAVREFAKAFKVFMRSRATPNAERSDDDNQATED
jgi:hypothetical protein